MQVPSVGLPPPGSVQETAPTQIPGALRDDDPDLMDILTPLRPAKNS